MQVNGGGVGAGGARRDALLPIAEDAEAVLTFKNSSSNMSSL